MTPVPAEESSLEMTARGRFYSTRAQLKPDGWYVLQGPINPFVVVLLKLV